MKQFDTRTKSIISMLLLLVLVLGACAKVSVPEPVQISSQVKTIGKKWPLLEEDGFHDPTNPLLKKKQQPREGLSTLPPNDYGNHINWVTARVEGLINPRRSIQPTPAEVEVEVPVMDLDIYLNLWGSQPIVRFPHLAHEQWLHCENCHEMPVLEEKIFIPQEGSNNIRMEGILSGEKCGVCHSAVAFPVSNCFRCHSVDRNSIDGVKARERARLKGRKPNFFSDGRPPPPHALPARATPAAARAVPVPVPVVAPPVPAVAVAPVPAVAVAPVPAVAVAPVPVVAVAPVPVVAVAPVVIPVPVVVAAPEPVIEVAALAVPPAHSLIQPGIAVLQTDVASLKVGEKTELKNMLFQTGKSVLLPQSKLELNNLVTHMNSEPNLAIEISGHTDNVGKKASNLSLSKARAKAVVTYMVSKGIAAERLSFKGYGSEQAVADNKTAAGRAKNRRVEVMVITK